MYYITLIVVIVGFLITGCAPQSQHAGHDMASMDTYTVESVSSASGIAFTVLNGQGPVTDFPMIHERPMHLIVVRDDLTQFSHLHPVMGSGGMWNVDFTPAAGGTYWMYADFADTKGRPVVQRFIRAYEGKLEPYGVKPDASVKKTVGGMNVEFSAVFDGKKAALTYVVTKGGKPVTLEPYLGANGHAVVLTADGQYLHAHAETGEALSFEVTLPAEDAFYRSFVQFQVDGTVHTVSFDLVQRP